MKLDKIFLLSILLLTSCDSFRKEIRNAERMEEYYYSDEYLFASVYEIYYKNGNYSVIDYINEEFDSIGKNRIEKDNVIESCQNGDNLVYLINNSDNEQDIDLYVMVYNVYSRDVAVLDSFSAYELFDRNVETHCEENFEFNNNFFVNWMSTEENLVEICFWFSFNNQDVRDVANIFVNYDIDNMKKVHENFHRNWSSDYSNTYFIENHMFCIDGRHINDIYGLRNGVIVRGTVNYSGEEEYLYFTINRKILQKDKTFDEIDSEIYDDQGFFYYYLVYDETLFVVIYFENESKSTSPKSTSNNTVRMIFKINIKNETAEYLGYIPLKTYLRGVFYKEPR